MSGLRYILPVCLGLIFSNADIIDLDKYISSDKNETNVTNETKVKNRDGYMPNIITPEYAKSGFYGGLALGAGLTNFKTSSLNEDVTSTDLSLVGGYNFSKYIAAEGRATMSIANDNSIDYSKVSLFLKPQYEVYSGLNLYSLLGFGNISAKSIGDESTYSSKASLQLGVGADYKLGKNFKLFADYTYLGEDTKARYKSQSGSMKSASITTGITYDF